MATPEEQAAMRAADDPGTGDAQPAPEPVPVAPEQPTVPASAGPEAVADAAGQPMPGVYDPSGSDPAAAPPDAPVLPPDDVAQQPAPQPDGDVWAFGPSVDGVSQHQDGDTVPHRSFHVLRNGQPVGEASIYMRPHAGDTTFVAAFRAFERPHRS